jgi:hypothetical protein
MTSPSAINVTLSLTNPGLRREIRFEPAYDKRHPDSSKNYGIHGVTMTWYVVGEDGAAQFKVFTNWHLPKVQDELEHRDCKRMPDFRNPGSTRCTCITLAKPMAADLGYHRKTPAYANQSPMDGTCEWIGGKCYYDGSGLNAERVFDLLVTDGGEAVWRELEDYYQEVVP